MERLEAVYGDGWPRFHDAVVVRFELSCDATRRPVSSSAVLGLHWWLTKAINVGTADLHYVKEKETVTTLRLTGIEEAELHDFGLGCIVNDLTLDNRLEQGLPGLVLELASSYGCWGRILCKAIDIESVCPVGAAAA